eukprot:2161916-Pleurochrysis_carterae.AAC.2
MHVSSDTSSFVRNPVSSAKSFGQTQMLSSDTRGFRQVQRISSGTTQGRTCRAHVHVRPARTRAAELALMRRRASQLSWQMRVVARALHLPCDADCSCHATC